jgi:hypothetical protein
MSILSEYASKKLDEEKYDLDNYIGERVQDIIKNVDEDIFENYQKHHDSFEKSQHKALTWKADVTFYRALILFFLLSTAFSLLPSNDYTIISTTRFISLTWIELLYIVLFILVIAVPIVISDHLENAVSKFKNDWIKYRVSLKENDAFLAVKSKLKDISPDELKTSEKSSFNRSRISIYEEKPTVKLIDRSIAKIKYTGVGIAVKKHEELPVLLLFAAFYFGAMILAGLAYSAYKYFFAVPEAPILTDIISYLFFALFLAWIPSQKLDNNELKYQLVELYIDCDFYLSIAEDFFDVDVAEARKDLLHTLKFDQVMSAVSPEVFDNSIH